MLDKDAWIPTYRGGRFYPLNPVSDDIYIEDIAHALSLVCRYVGHVRFHYSVAHHSLLVAGMLPDSIKLEGLMHDAAEAYLSDISRDVKKTAGMDQYKRWEHRLERVIANKFGLRYPWPEEVKVADTQILAREGASLFPVGSDMWAQWNIMRSSDYAPIFEFSPRYIEESFLQRFYQYEANRGLSDDRSVA